MSRLPVGYQVCADPEYQQHDISIHQQTHGQDWTAYVALSAPGAGQRAGTEVE